MTQNLEAIRRFILGGIAIFTIVSKKIGDRKTFRVRAAEDVDGSGKPHGYYVDLLTGPNNTEDYTYLCYIWTDAAPFSRRQAARTPGEFLHYKQNKKGWGTDAMQAFGWLVACLNNHGQDHFECNAEFCHAGLCSRCGRTLTDPESIELGIGPVCRGKG